MATTAFRLRADGTTETVSSIALKVGDKVAVEASQVIPGDGDVIEGGALRARRGLKMAIFRLRRKIERDPCRPDLVLTESGLGYRLAPESDLAWFPDALLGGTFASP